MTEVTDKVERAIARFDRVTRQLDERDGPVRDAARRERQRLNADLAKPRQTRWHGGSGHQPHHDRRRPLHADRHVRLPGCRRSGDRRRRASRLHARRETRSIAAHRRPISRTARWSSASIPISTAHGGACPRRRRRRSMRSAQSCRRCKQTLERVDTLDPTAQDARRLMSIHLPGLIDRYCNVPAAYRSERDGEDKTVDERLSKGSPRANRRSQISAKSSRAPTCSRSRRRAASSSRVTAQRRARTRHRPGQGRQRSSRR